MSQKSKKRVRIVKTKEDKHKEIALWSAVSVFCLVTIIFWGINFKKTLASTNFKNETKIFSNIQDNFSGLSQNYEKINNN
ncbi:MAG: hypothetical protein NT091_05295 [Candidatus Falkowbacteria bacterium]|nr:hypothetical protein [Candidatus Falkowbacteria bacterium]